MLAYARMASRSYADIEEPLRAGELVRLKSGGPVMVVSDVRREDGVVNVIWQDKLGAEHDSGFQAELLKRTRRSFFGLRR